MRLLFDIFVFLHFVGWAMVLGGYLASLRTQGLYRGVFHGAATALVSGVVMLGLIEGGAVGSSLQQGTLYAKFVIVLVITVLAFFARRQSLKRDNGTGRVVPWMKHAIGGLTTVNIVLAVFVR